MTPIDPKYLVSPVLSSNTLDIAGPDKELSIYFHEASGPIFVGAGSFPQEINTIVPSSDWLSYAKSQLFKLSSRINLQFSYVNDPLLADISFYMDSVIDLGHDDSLSLGLTIANSDSNTLRKWIEIFFHGPALNSSHQSLSYYVFNHELLHALGLEHPFDESDGDYYLSTESLFSATSAETVMSYIPPLDGVWPLDLSQNDVDALISIWGPSPSTLDVFRLYDPINDTHLYSANPYEIDLLTGESTSYFKNEGIAYSIHHAAGDDLYRFYRPQFNCHFYTSNSDERDFLILHNQQDFIYEGVAFHVFNTKSQPIGASPMVRLFDPSRSIHFYSSNPNEILKVQSAHVDWINEGIAWYV